MTLPPFLTRSAARLRKTAVRYGINAVKVQLLLVGVGVVLLAASTTLSILKVRSGYEAAVAEYKSTLWYATQIEFEFSRFLNALDVMGTGAAGAAPADVNAQFRVLKQRFPALVRGIRNTATGDADYLSDGIERLQQILRKIEAPLSRMRRGDIRTYLQIRSDIESGLAPLRGIIAETEARGEGAFESRQARIEPFFSDMFLYAVGTFFGGAFLILLLLRQIRHTHRALEKVEQARSAMNEAREEAEAANRAKSHFLAVMSHEIRTPMNGVLGMASLLGESRLTPQQTDYLDTLRTSGEALLTILNDILDFSKLEVGRVDLDRSRFDPADIVEDVASLFASAAHEKGVELAVELDPSLTSSIESDPGRLRQILLNLVGNAVKFTEAGGVVILARPETTSDGTNSIRFEIADSGIGVPEDRRDAVFEDFRQADPSVSRKYGGTGLGLAICKRLVGVLGGEIGYAPNLANQGRGSIFWFTVPVGDGALVAPQPEIDAALAGRHALIVCGNPILGRDLVNNLKAQGITVEEASGPGAAIARISDSSRSEVDFVVMDAQMPGFRPAYFAERVAALHLAPSPRIILVLPAAQAIQFRDSGPAGFAATLSKPLRRREVARTLKAVLLGEPATDPEIDGAPRGDAVAPLPSRNYRLLLAEDGKVNQEVAAVMLRRAGYEVDVVDDGVSALHALEARHYDLVLMDIHMPEADGFQATEAIRALGTENARVPIIAMTANALADNRQACLEAGMDGFLTKPIDRDEMLATIAQVLSVEHAGVLPPPARRAPSARGPEAPPAPHPEASVIDAETLSRFEHDVGSDALAPLLEEFIGETHDLVDRARRSLAAGDLADIGRMAHSLRSSAATIGAVALEAAAAVVETACSDRRSAGLDAALDRMDCAAQDAVAALESRLPKSRDEARAAVVSGAG